MWQSVSVPHSLLSTSKLFWKAKQVLKVQCGWVSFEDTPFCWSFPREAKRKKYHLVDFWGKPPPPKKIIDTPQTKGPPTASGSAGGSCVTGTSLASKLARHEASGWRGFRRLVAFWKKIDGYPHLNQGPPPFLSKKNTKKDTYGFRRSVQLPIANSASSETSVCFLLMCVGHCPWVCFFFFSRETRQAGNPCRESKDFDTPCESLAQNPVLQWSTQSRVKN